MLFVDFFSLVEKFATPKSAEFRKEIRKQISFLKIKPKQYEDIFDFSDLTAGLDWEIDLNNLVKMFQQGKGDLDKAIAFYYLFHNREPFFPAARNLDYFLFGDGVEIASKYDLEKFGSLPSCSINDTDLTDSQPSALGNDEKSPTDILLKITDRLTGNDAVQEFILRLDWTEKENAFRFDPEKFEGNDEILLDRILQYLGLAGGIIRRGEIGIRDANLLRSWVKIVLGNAEVQKYIGWIQNDGELSDHTSFLDAIYLHEMMIAEQIPEYEAYKKVAEAVLEDLEK